MCHNYVSISEAICGCAFIVSSRVLTVELWGTNLNKACSTRSLVFGTGLRAIDEAIFFGWSSGNSTLRNIVSSSSILFLRILVATAGQKS